VSVDGAQEFEAQRHGAAIPTRATQLTTVDTKDSRVLVRVQPQRRLLRASVRNLEADRTDAVSMCLIDCSPGLGIAG
jgi:hypothetical protein